MKIKRVAIALVALVALCYGSGFAQETVVEVAPGDTITFVRRDVPRFGIKIIGIPLPPIQDTLPPVQLPPVQDTLPPIQLPPVQDTLPAYQDTLPPIQDTIPCLCDTIPAPPDTTPPAPTPPDAVTGVTLSINGLELVSDWNLSTDADLYEVVVLNESTGIVEAIAITAAPPSRISLDESANYLVCISARNDIGLSDSNCNSIRFDLPPPPTTPDSSTGPPLSVTDITLTLEGDTLVMAWTERPQPDRAGNYTLGYYIGVGNNTTGNNIVVDTLVSGSPQRIVLKEIGSHWGCTKPMNEFGVPEGTCDGIEFALPVPPDTIPPPVDPPADTTGPITQHTFTERLEDGWTERQPPSGWYTTGVENGDGYGQANYYPSLCVGCGPIQVRRGFVEENEITVNMRWKLSPNFAHHTGSNQKKIFFLEAHSEGTGDNGPNAIIFGVHADGWFWLGTQNSAEQPGGARVAYGGNWVTNQIYDVKLYIKLNTVDANGNSNPDGIGTVWVDGTRIIHNTDYRFRGEDAPTKGRYAYWQSSWGITGIRWNPTWPNGGDPPAEYMWERIYDFAVYRGVQDSIIIPPPVDPPVDTLPPPVEPPITSTAWFVEDYSTYATIEEYFQRTSNGRYRTGGTNPSRQFLDSANGFEGSPHSLRYDFPDATTWTSRCDNYSIGRSLYFPEPTPEVWVETWVKFTDNFHTAPPADWNCSENPDLKLLFGMVSPDQQGRFEVKIGKFGHSWATGSPNREDVTVPLAAAPYWDNNWHQIRTHWKVAGPGSAEKELVQLWVDGNLEWDGILDPDPIATTIWGLKLGANRNSGADVPMSYWWGKTSVWRTQPEWDNGTTPPIEPPVDPPVDTIPPPVEPPVDTTSAYLLSVSAIRYEMTGVQDVVEGNYYIHLDRPDGAWRDQGDIVFPGVDSVVFVLDGLRNREGRYPYEAQGDITPVGVGTHTVSWEVFGVEPESGTATFEGTSNGVDPPVDPPTEPPVVPPTGMTLPDATGAILWWDYENIVDSNQWQTAPWRDLGLAEPLGHPDRQFIDFTDPFPGLTRSIRYDFRYNTQADGAISQTTQAAKHFDGWETTRQGQEIWMEFAFRVNDLFTACSMVKNPCDYKTVFGLAWPDQNGRFGIHMFGGNGAAAVEGRTYGIIWKTPTGIVAGDPAATGVGSSTPGMGQKVWYQRGRDTGWNKVQFYMRFSSQAGGTVETNSMDAKAVMWLNGEKFADSEESGIVFGTYNKFNPSQPVWIRGCSMGRNKDKGGGFSPPEDFPLIESIWFAYCAMWDSPTSYTNSWGN